MTNKYVTNDTQIIPVMTTQSAPDCILTLKSSMSKQGWRWSTVLKKGGTFKLKSDKCFCYRSSRRIIIESYRRKI